jgi:uncharacterized UPF0160 family protein
MAALKLVTHDGSFHTDDVFACATLSLAYKDREIEIERTRDMEVINKADIAFDVGDVYDPVLGRFDHHQKGGAGSRDNGVPYASFGLVWKEYGTRVTDSIEAMQFIDEQLVQGIDGADNGYLDRVSTKGVYVYSIIDTISALRPTWLEEKNMNEAFLDAVNMAVTILERTIAHTKSFEAAHEKLEKAYEEAIDKQIIDIEYEYPGWNEVMSSRPEPLFVIYKREDGSWTSKGVRSNPAELAVRKKYPESWGGLRNEELQKVSGVSDAIFCHNGRFTAVAKSKEGAIQLARNAISS